jgi:hypothetical protein
MEAPGTWPAASMTSLWLRAIGSIGSVLAKRSKCLVPVACAGATIPSTSTAAIKAAAALVISFVPAQLLHPFPVVGRTAKRCGPMEASDFVMVNSR